MEVILKKGNILSFNGKIIVNTANSSLYPGLGLDGQIHKQGGILVTNACSNYKNKHGALQPGNSIITTGGNLTQDYIIHTVGPFWKGGKFKEEEILFDAYTSCLKIADEYSSSVALPNISTGIFKFPKKKAAEISIDAIKKFKGKQLKKVFIYCFEESNYLIYKNLLKNQII